MNPLMQAEEFYLAAYERTNIAGTPRAHSEATDEITGRRSVGKSFQPYLFKQVERHTLECVI